MEEEEEGEGYNEFPGEWDDPNDKRPTEVAITKEIIRDGLSRIARTLDTFEFAYSRLECRKKNISKLDILGGYLHLRLIDLGENKIKSCTPIAPIQNLLLLNLEDNLIESLVEIPEFPFLQALCLRRNRLTSSEGMFANCLAYLQLGENAIEDVFGFTSDVFPYLTVLELKGNKLSSIKGLDLPQLQRLYIGHNLLKDLKGLEGCPNLTHLHARENRISVLEDFPALEKLEYINLRANDLRRYTQMLFLGNSTHVKTLVLKENPISTLADYKLEVLAANPSLRRLDKDPILETQLVEAKQLRNGRDDGFINAVQDDPELLKQSYVDLTDETEEFPDGWDNSEN